jgi:uncharacterized membrane protein YeaQ/YmgE (transglycosylase-associated protein family)
MRRLARMSLWSIYAAKKNGGPMHLLWAIIVGLIVGALARAIMPGKDPGGVLMTLALGIGGSIVADLLGSALRIYRPGATGPGILASVIGAVLLLAVYRAIVRHRAHLGPHARTSH